MYKIEWNQNVSIICWFLCVADLKESGSYVLFLFANNQSLKHKT